MGNSRSKGKGRLGFLFWIAFILFVGVIYLANREDITSVLESTRFVEIVSTKIKGDDPTVVVERRQEPVPSSEEESGDGSLDDAPVASEEEGAPTDQPEAEAGAGTEAGAEAGAGTEEPEEGSDADDESDGALGTEATEEDPPEVETVTAVEQVPEREEPGPTLRRTRESKLYYIRVTEDGTIYPQAVTREVYYTDSPMTETLKALLSGPTIEELNMGLLNLIPEGTELRSAWVKNGIAYLNFNEQFRFNPMGVEGFMAQLQQIVFSVTEFSTIEEVQILIEGERVQYLGGEGIYIGEPLGRRHFSS
jgi:spore germination protein GerM